MTEPNSRIDYYRDQTIVALTSSFQEFDFGRTMDGHQLINGGGGTISISYDGTNTDFELNTTEAVTYDFCRRSKIYLKGSGVSYRLRAWATA